MSDAVVTVLATTRAVRRHLDLDGVVSRSALDGCIALALQAPSPSNTQGLELVIVDEPCTRAAPAELYRRAFDSYAASPVRDYPEHDARAGREPAVRASAHYLSDRLHEVPVLIVPVGAGRLSASAPASV